MTTPPDPPVGYFRTLPGRLFILTSVLWLIVGVSRQFVELPPIVDVFRKVVILSWIVAVSWLGAIAIARHRRRFLWRVRQKLILSYVFLGFVPVLLVLALALAGGLILYMNVAGYMFHEGFADISDVVLQASETSAAEIGRAPAATIEAITRKYDNLAPRYPSLSLAVIPLTAPAPASEASPAIVRTRAPASVPMTAGPWRHTPAPSGVPAWLADRAGGFRGVVAVPVPGSPGEWMLVMRALMPTRDHTRAVLVDLPVGATTVVEIEARTKIRMGPVTVPERCGGPPDTAVGPEAARVTTLFRHSVAWVDCTDWHLGETGTAAVSLDAPVGKLYSRVAALQAAQLGTGSNDFLIVFAFLGFFFLVIQGSALFMGGLLARSITYAVHELFVGTERIQQGDFTHRIRIDSGDQLGDLAAQFNRMSGSMEHFMHVQREKQRLDDELRIAREIQKSLLPTSPPVMEGLTIADLCEPAREVGGDYYDFFELGPRRLGIMVADVSGKGTSAALYMAELKGLMLALSRQEQSPRRLLIEANGLLAEHLDNRSFITMTYAIVDLDARTLTSARAGHTPLIVVSGGCSDVITSSGMVLGLRLPGAAERFGQVLEEHTRSLCPGDVIVLYTDGITEAMNEAGDLFSDESLARVVSGQDELDAAGIRERVVREVGAFVGNAEPHDDMTMIVLKLDGVSRTMP